MRQLRIILVSEIQTPIPGSEGKGKEGNGAQRIFSEGEGKKGRFRERGHCVNPPLGPTAECVLIGRASRHRRIQLQKGNENARTTPRMQDVWVSVLTFFRIESLN